MFVTEHNRVVCLIILVKRRLIKQSVKRAAILDEFIGLSLNLINVVHHDLVHYFALSVQLLEVDVFGQRRFYTKGHLYLVVVFRVQRRSLVDYRFYLC